MRAPFIVACRTLRAWRDGQDVAMPPIYIAGRIGDPINWTGEIAEARRLRHREEAEWVRRVANDGGRLQFEIETLEEPRP